MGADRTRTACGPDPSSLFSNLSDRGHLALAVSGGSDSAALMWLAGEWLKQDAAGTTFTVLTVDHGLRPEAADEARLVGEWAQQAGFAHLTLVNRAAKPTSGIQDTARQLRYDLMTQWCRENSAGAIVTAHTLDDQVETFLMRLGRGSGVDGLSGMSEEIAEPWPIVRPLLGVDRSSLRAWLSANGKDWIEDPSNEDVQFERVRMRKLALNLADAGIEAEAIGLSARRLARARRALEGLADELWSLAAQRDQDGRLLLARRAVMAAPCDLRLRVLERAIREVGGRGQLRMAALERLDEWLSAAADARARTLGGCRISLRKRHIVITGEPGRRQRAPGG